MRELIVLDTDDCLLIADLLRVRLARAAREKQHVDDLGEIKRLQQEFRALSKEEDYLQFAVVVRS